MHVGAGPDGSLTYLVGASPEEFADRCTAATWSAPGTRRVTLPWHSAGASPASSASNATTAPYGDLALADRDACCWADAVDGTVGMRNSYGLSVCLRLLALVDLLARVRWADSLCLLQRDGAELHPSLLRAAASSPLTAEARFDETSFRGRLAQFAFGLALEGQTAHRLTGATP